MIALLEQLYRGDLRGRGGWRGGRSDYPPPGPPRYHPDDRFYDRRPPPPPYYESRGGFYSVWILISNALCLFQTIELMTSMSESITTGFLPGTTHRRALGTIQLPGTTPLIAGTTIGTMIPGIATMTRGTVTMRIGNF